MNRRFLIIISGFALLAILVVGYVKFRIEPLPHLPPTPQLACQTDNDCTTVNDSCDFCSCGSPINKNYEAQYQTKVSKQCKGYQGGVCDVYCPSQKVRCVNSICQFVALPSK